MIQWMVDNAGWLGDFRLPVGDWVEAVVLWIQLNLTAVLDGFAPVIRVLTGSFEQGHLALPAWLLALGKIGRAACRGGGGGGAGRMGWCVQRLQEGRGSGLEGG